MVVTIFRSCLNPEHAGAYQEMAARMRTLAEGEPGFISFKTFNSEDGERVSLIEFESEETLRAWREHPEHRKAQELGRTAFYAKFQIQVCSIIRQYGSQSSNARFERDAAKSAAPLKRSVICLKEALQKLLRSPSVLSRARSSLAYLSGMSRDSLRGFAHLCLLATLLQSFLNSETN